MISWWFPSVRTSVALNTEVTSPIGLAPSSSWLFHRRNDLLVMATKSWSSPLSMTRFTSHLITHPLWTHSFRPVCCLEVCVSFFNKSGQLNAEDLSIYGNVRVYSSVEWINQKQNTLNIYLSSLWSICYVMFFIPHFSCSGDSHRRNSSIKRYVRTCERNK